MFLLDYQQLALWNISFTLNPNLILVNLRNCGEWLCLSVCVLSVPPHPSKINTHQIQLFAVAV